MLHFIFADVRNESVPATGLGLRRRVSLLSLPPLDVLPVPVERCRDPCDFFPVNCLPRRQFCTPFSTYGVRFLNHESRNTQPLNADRTLSVCRGKGDVGVNLLESCVETFRGDFDFCMPGVLSPSMKIRCSAQV